MYYVIGSGPAGIACAYALLRKGVEVTLIDAGLQLETSRREQVTGLQGSDPGEWHGAKSAFLREGMDATTEGIPLKRAYGSDFPYRPAAGATEIALRSVSLASSYAQGGLSNVWGAAVLPYRQRDISDWPIDIARLEKHYRSVFEFMPLAARRDDLEEEFPLYAQTYAPLAMSRQASSMLRGMERHRTSLNSRGIRFGGARLAVAARKNGRDCARCGLCMYGCPYELIYLSSATLELLGQFERFHYAPGFRVARVEEADGQVKIFAFSLEGGASQIFGGERVYVACGVLSTTALLLRSLDQFDRAVSAADSQYFLLPILRFRGATDVRNEPLHTLAQLFLEIDDPKVSHSTVHLQTYTYNDLFAHALRSALGPLAAAAPGNALLSRLLLFQGYLHSSHSVRIQIELRRKGAEQDVLYVSAAERAQSKEPIRELVRKLFRLSGQLGAVPLFPLLRAGAPGRGFHTGGSLPMRAHPQDFETDVFGRPAGLTRVHAVDASIFPSIPATTITLTAMANAHRIGDELEYYA